MRLIVCFLMLASTAYAVPKFVVTKWQPGKKLVAKTVAPTINETPADAAVIAPVALDCGCVGDVSNCKCERGKCDCTQCKCKDCGTPAAQLSAKAQAKATALEADGIWWDEEFLTEAMKPSVNSQQQRERVYIYTPKWCAACPKTKAAIGDGDEEVEIIYMPTEVQGAKAYPAYWYPKRQQFYYNVRVENGTLTSIPWINNSLDTLKMELQIDPVTGGLPAGEIKRGLVEKILPLLKLARGAGLDNDEADLPLGPVTFRLPKNFRMSWTTSDGTTNFKPSEPPRIKWGWLLNKQVNGIAYNGDQIEFDVPKLPNLILKIVGPKTVESAIPNSPPAAPVVSKIGDLISVPATVARRTAEIPNVGHWTYPGPRTRENLIGHILSQHPGLYSEQELRTFDLTTLERIHSYDHHQRQRGRYAMTRTRQTRGYCPTCPGRG